MVFLVMMRPNSPFELGISVVVAAAVALTVLHFLRARRVQSDPRRSSQPDCQTDSVSADTKASALAPTAPWQSPGPSGPGNKGVTTPTPRRDGKPETWTLELIRSLEWKYFEDLCAGYYREFGRRAEVTGLGADGGIDIKLYQESEPGKLWGVVQCKAWNQKTIGVREVRELLGIMTDAGCPLGVYITTSSYTNEAKAFARVKPIQLLSGTDLLQLILELPEASQRRLLAEATKGDYTTPSCPNCGVKLVLRSTVTGTDASKRFWGCRNYPRCHYTMGMRTADINVSSPAHTRSRTIMKNLIMGLIATVFVIVIAVVVYKLFMQVATQSINNITGAQVEAVKRQQAKIADQGKLRQVQRPQSTPHQKMTPYRQPLVQTEVAKERAWDTWYKEPDGCDYFTSDRHMVECVNHRIRRKKVFEALWAQGKIDR